MTPTPSSSNSASLTAKKLSRHRWNSATKEERNRRLAILELVWGLHERNQREILDRRMESLAQAHRALRVRCPTCGQPAESPASGQNYSRSYPCVSSAGTPMGPHPARVALSMLLPEG